MNETTLSCTEKDAILDLEIQCNLLEQAMEMAETEENWNTLHKLYEIRRKKLRHLKGYKERCF